MHQVLTMVAVLGTVFCGNGDDATAMPDHGNEADRAFERIDRHARSHVADAQQGDILFQRTRDDLLTAYASAQPPVPFYATTKPYKSSLPLVWNVVQAVPAGAVTMAYAKCLAGQKIEFFSYGVGEAMPFNPVAGIQKIATEGDTNLSKGRRTNGVEDFVIEGISASSRGKRLIYPAGTTADTDPDVVAMFAGNLEFGDPAALFAPPQVASPFNLEDVMWEILKPNLAIEFEWDRARVEKIGTIDEIPEGGAKSFLRASGDPRTDNRYKIPEGYLWRKQGQSDSEFIARATVTDTVIIPVSLVPIDGAAVVSTPTAILQDIVMRLHGLAVKAIGHN